MVSLVVFLASIIGILAVVYYLKKLTFSSLLDRKFTLLLHNILPVVTSVTLVFSILNYYQFSLLKNIVAEAAADPQVSITVPDTLIGSSFDISTVFSNNTGTNAGFGPFIDLIIPVNGTDGLDGDAVAGSVTEIDGILSVNSATYLGSSLNVIELVFPDDTGMPGGPNTGCVEHPFAVDNTAAPLEVCGNTGDILAVAQLPFGSFVPDQPNAEVIFNVTMSELADINQPLLFQTRGGFMFGNDEFNNPTDDPSIIESVFSSATTLPQIVTFEKTQNNAEEENSIGPNFPYQYTLSATIAEGQTVDNFQLIDELPNNMVFLSVIDSSPGCAITAPVPPTTNPTNGSILTMNCGTVAPPTSSVFTTFEVYISDADADGESVINHTSCDDTLTTNNAYSTGDWNPVDYRDEDPFDPLANNSFVTPIESIDIDNKCIQIQKSNSIIADTGFNGYTPGDTLEYQLDFQISDYFALGDIDIQDTIEDGIHLIDNSHPDYAVPTLEILHGGTSVTSGAISPSNFVVTNNWTGATPPPTLPDGTTIIDINVSGELVSRGLSSILYGGCVSPDSSQSIDCETASPTYDAGATIGRLTYRAEILDYFTDNPGDPSIDHFDNINNAVSIEGGVIDNSDRISPTGSTESDTSSSNVNIRAGSLRKNILAVNGGDASGVSSLSPGDAVTYQLIYNLPSSDTESFTIEDYLPKPVFDVTDLNMFITPDGSGLRQASTSPIYDMPPIGEFWLGPTDTFYALSSDNPVITSSTPGNSFVLDFGNFDDPLNTPTTVDIVFTVEVSDAPFADGLLLTNQAIGTEANTNGTQSTTTEINQIVLDMPELNITKGVIDSNNPSEVFNPINSYTGVSFDPVSTSSVCNHFTGTISSSLIDSEPIISDIENIDGSDVVRFATVIENTGSNGTFDIQVRDTIPSGFNIPASGANVCVSRGDGTILSTANVGGGTGMFDQGIEIVDGPDGSILGYDDLSGENIIVITYDLQANDSLILQDSYVNRAAIFHYASREGGTNFGGPGDGDIVFDEAEIFPENIVELDKRVLRTEEPNTDITEITIGSLVQYEITLSINEGLTQDVKVLDDLGTGLALVSIDSITPSADISTNVTGGFPVIQSGAAITDSGQNVELDFGDITNINSDNDINETITVTYTAVVLNDSSVDNGDIVNNTATVEWNDIDEDGNSVTLNEEDGDNSINVIEPNIEVAKNVVETGGDAGDTITIELTINHAPTSSATGYDLMVTDALPAGMVFDAGFTTVSGIAPSAAGESGGTITLEYDELGLSEDSTVRFTVTLDGTVTPQDIITNEASLEYTSLQSDQSSPKSPYNNTSTEAEYTSGDSDSLQVDNYSVSKTIFNTEINDADVDGNPLTTGTDVVVGEQIQYQVVVEVPEGTNPSINLRDTLDAGLNLVSVDSIIASPGVTTSVTGGYAAVAAGVTNTPLSNGNKRINLDFDEVQNTNNDAAVETITVLYTVVVENTDQIFEGQSRNNRVQWRWGVPVTIVEDNAPNIIVREPDLGATKSSDIDNINFGDIVEYTIEITNNGSSPALDVEIDDYVPDVFSYVPSSISISTNHTASTDDSGAPNLAFKVDQIDVGETVTITYEMDVLSTVVAGQDYTNDVDITWTSLSGSDSGERNGDGSGENYYNTATSDDVVTDGVNVSKSIVSTSELDTTTSGDSIERVVVGEVVRYQLVTEVPESTLPNLEVVDYIPDGMQFINDSTATIAFVSNDDGVTNLISDSIPSGSYILGDSVTTPVFSIPTGSITNDSNNGSPFENGDDVKFELGNVVNGDEDNVDNEYIVIEFNALVLNNIINQGGESLVNSFEIFIDDGSGSDPQAESVVDSENTVIVAEPDISINKTITTIPVDAGDSVVYEIRVENGTGENISTAYDLNIQDVLNSNLILQSVSVSGPSNTDNSNISGNVVDVNIDELAPGEIVIVTVSAVVDTNVQNGDVIGNEGTYTYQSISEEAQSSSNPTRSATPGGEGDENGPRNGQDGQGSGLNNYAGSSNVDLMIGVPEIEKITPIKDKYVIGEEVVYEIVVTLPEGDTVDMAVTDNLPNGLEYVTHNIFTLASASINLNTDYNGSLANPSIIGGSGSGDDIQFNFGTTNTVDDNDPNNNAFVIQITARVINEVDNQNSVELTNSATIEWTNPDTGDTDFISDDADPITIIEPLLNINKSVDDDTVQFGQTITYTIDIAHAGNSTADAYDVLVTDAISGDLDYILGSSSLPAGWVVDESNAPIINFMGDIPLASTAQITFEAMTKDPGTYLKGTIIENIADISWSSLDGVTSDERAGGGGVNDYANSSSVDITISAPDLTVNINDSIGSTNPGDTNVYDVQIINVGNNPADNTVATIIIPPNTTFNSSASTSGWVCAPDNNPGSVCNLNVGTINPSGITNVDFALTIDSFLPAGADNITVEVEVADDGANGPECISTNNNASDIDSVDAAPDLSITKDDGINTLTPGTQTTYTLTITNVGNQDATGVLITDYLPSIVSFDSASDGGLESGGVVTWPVFDLNAGNTEIRTVTVTLNDPLDSGIDEVINTAIVADDGTNGLDLDSSNNEDNDINDTVAAPNLQVSKLVSSPATITNGSIVEYLINYDNIGNQDATGVELIEMVPIGTVFDTSNPLNSDWSCTSPLEGSNCVYPIGNLDVGGSGTASFVVIVNDPVNSDQESVVNSISITDDGNNGSDTDPSDNTYTETTSLLATPDLRTEKTDNQTVVSAGQSITYIIQVFNDGNQNVEDARLVDTLPIGVSFVSASGGGTESGGIISWPGFDLQAGESMIFTVTVTLNNPVSAGLNTITNTATASFTPNSTDVDPTDNNTSSDTDTVEAAPDLMITKTDNGLTLTPGSSFVYNISYSNDGTQDATGVTITDTVPAHTTFDSSNSTPGWNCLPDNNPGSVCTLSIGSLAGGDSGVAVFGVVVDTTLGTGVDSTNNTVSITDDGTNGTDENPANNTYDESTTVNALPEIYIQKDDGGVTVKAGEPIMYTLDWGNSGNQDATGVSITETIPFGTTIDLSDPLNSGWSCTGLSAGSTCIYSVGSLDSGDTGGTTFVIMVNNPVVSGLHSIINTVSITDDGTNGTEVNTINNSDTVSTELNAAPDLYITKDNGLTEINPEDEFSYTITVENIGTQDATGVAITDILPSHLVFVSASDGGLESGGVVAWPVVDINVGDSVTRTLTVRFDIPEQQVPAGLETITNTASVFDDGVNGSDLDGSNNIDEDTDSVNGDIDLTVTIDDGQNTVETGQEVVYKVAINNDGTQFASNTVATIVIPEGVTFNPATSSPGWICTPDGNAGSTCTINVGTVDTLTDSCAFFGVTVDDPSNVDEINISVTVADDGTSGPELDNTNNTNNDVDNITGNPNLTVTKTDNQNIAVPGESLVYEVEVTNNGDIILTGIEVLDMIPEYSSYIASSNSGVYDSSNRVVAWSGITLLPRESSILTVEVLVDESVPSGVVEITNNVSAADDGTHGVESDPSDNQFQDVNEVDAQPELEVVIEAQQDTAYPGEEVEFLITHTNLGEQDASGVEVTFTIPEYTTGQPTSQTTGSNNLEPLGLNIGWACPDLNPGTVCTYFIGNVAAGEDCVIPFFVVLDEDLDPENTQIIGETTVYDDGLNGAEITLVNNNDNDTIVIPFADVEIQKYSQSDNVNFGDEINFSITYQNNGPSDATEVVVTDNLPAELVYISGTLNGQFISPTISTNNEGTSNIEFAIGTIPSGGSGEIVLTAEVVRNTNTAIINTVIAAAREAEITMDNNDSATDLIEVYEVLDLPATKGLLRTGGVLTQETWTLIAMFIFGSISIIGTMRKRNVD